jgi:quercetin dioxygenase-like cupin family protein
MHPDRKLSSEQSDSVISIVEHSVPAGWDGVPLQHSDVDEAFYVLEGELTFQAGEELWIGAAGAFAFAPRGADHAVANAGEMPARYLVIRTPAEPASEVVVVGPPILERDDLEPAKALPTERDRINVLLREADSDGAVSVMDNAVAAEFGGPPLHHHDFDEAFYVLEGELTFQLGDDVFTRGPGELAFAPRGAHHTFANLSGAPARQLLVCTPAGFERYFDQMAAKQAGVDPPVSAREPWPEVTVVGPQIGRG